MLEILSLSLNRPERLGAVFLEGIDSSSTDYDFLSGLNSSFSSFCSEYYFLSAFSSWNVVIAVSNTLDLFFGDIISDNSVAENLCPKSSESSNFTVFSNYLFWCSNFSAIICLLSSPSSNISSKWVIKIFVIVTNILECIKAYSDWTSALIILWLKQTEIAYEPILFWGYFVITSFFKKSMRNIRVK